VIIDQAVQLFTISLQVSLHLTQKYKHYVEIVMTNPKTPEIQSAKNLLTYLIMMIQSV